MRLEPLVVPFDFYETRDSWRYPDLEKLSTALVEMTLLLKLQEEGEGRPATVQLQNHLSYRVDKIQENFPERHYQYNISFPLPGNLQLERIHILRNCPFHTRPYKKQRVIMLLDYYQERYLFPTHEDIDESQSLWEEV